MIASLIPVLLAASLQVVPAREEPPAELLGTFEDDYGIRYSITADEWLQLPDSRYHVVSWHTSDQYVIARNDEANPADGGLWTRIDWVHLDSAEEYPWAFCYTAYAAESAATAAAASANRAEPRSGCNSFPFSRMRRE